MNEALGQTWIPLATLVVCGEEHAYDSYRYNICPSCGGLDRLHVKRALDKKGATEESESKSKPKGKK